MVHTQKFCTVYGTHTKILHSAWYTHKNSAQCTVHTQKFCTVHVTHTHKTRTG